MRAPTILQQLARAALRRAGTPPIGTSDGIASLEQVELNGEPQWALLRGRDASKPLLIYVHGGPGSAEMALAHRSMALLEGHFVCVNWDQRGAGKSFAPGADPQTMKIARFVDDTIALIELLRARFHQEAAQRAVGARSKRCSAKSVATSRLRTQPVVPLLSSTVSFRRPAS
jgi:hypothetical protein